MHQFGEQCCVFYIKWEFRYSAANALKVYSLSLSLSLAVFLGLLFIVKAPFLWTNWVLAFGSVLCSCWLWLKNPLAWFLWEFFFLAMWLTTPLGCDGIYLGFCCYLIEKKKKKNSNFAYFQLKWFMIANSVLLDFRWLRNFKLVNTIN